MLAIRFFGGGILALAVAVAAGLLLAARARTGARSSGQPVHTTMSAASTDAKAACKPSNSTRSSRNPR